MTTIQCYSNVKKILCLSFFLSDENTTINNDFRDDGNMLKDM